MLFVNKNTRLIWCKQLGWNLREEKVLILRDLTKGTTAQQVKWIVRLILQGILHSHCLVNDKLTLSSRGRLSISLLVVACLLIVGKLNVWTAID
jgi:hypothetical protein